MTDTPKHQHAPMPAREPVPSLSNNATDTTSQYAPPPVPTGDAAAALILRAAADAIVAIDVGSTILALNPAAERLFGGTAAELLGSPLTQLMPPELARMHDAGLARYIASGVRRISWEAADAVVQQLHTKEHVPVTISFADHDQDGVRMFVAVLRNRTEQQRQATALQVALSALHASERRTATILESLPVGVAVTDAQGHTVYTNAAAVELGIMPRRNDDGDLLPFLEIDSATTGGAYPEADRPLAHALRGETVVADDIIVRQQDGVDVPLEFRATPLRNEHGEIVGALAVCRDLRGERAAQAAVRESEGRYRDLVEHSSEILTWHTLDGRLLSVNPAMLRSLRMTADEVPMQMMDLLPPDHHAGFIEYVQRVQRDGKDTGMVTVIASDGTRRIWQYHSTIRRDGVAEPVVRSIVTDVTEARARERLLADRENRLRHAQKVEAVGKLAGGIAHDFNNILTVIAGHLALVNDESEQLPAQTRADLDEVTRAVDRATRLTRRLLGFSRKQLLTPRVFDANTLIAELEPMLARVLDERIAFAAHLTPTPARIFIDPSVLEGALVNLAVNARDAMPEGGTLTVDSSVRGNVVTISVRDSGAGMDAETLARAGEPFFTTKGAGVGTGLGLAMIYGSVEQSGGSITIESKPGVGTEVHLLFPLAPAEPDVAPADTDAAALDRAPASSQPTGRPISVLVVEDEDPLRRLVERILAREGYKVTVARHGADALQIAATMDPPVEVLITDLVMPEIGGRYVAEALRAIDPALPVLFISGYDPDPVMLDASEQANTGFLAKPFTGGALLAEVRRLAPVRRSDEA